MTRSTGSDPIRCRIFQPSKNAMQSGRAQEQEWLLEYEPEAPARPEPLMGWIASADTLSQVRLSFSSKEDAVAFALREGFDYEVEEPTPRRIPPKNYADNFRYAPPKPVPAPGK
jgi:hypothetical protein